jgi:cytoskeletal protein CcmA (bactofilin family)
VQKADEVVTAGKITVTMGARVAADLVACTVEVAGKVLGDVLASQECRVRCTAQVSGRILCRQLVLEPGAQIEGMVETIREGPS